MKNFVRLTLSVIVLFAFISCSYANSSNLSDRRIIKQIKKYNKKIKRNSENAKLYIKRGYLKFCLKDYNSAIEDLTLAQGIEPNNVDIYYLRGRAWFEKENYQDAMEDFDNALKLKKRDSKIYVSRGLVKDRIGEHESAIEDYTLAIKYNRKSRTAYINRGIANDKLGKPIAAIGDYQRAIKISKGIAPDAYYNMGLAQCKRKNYEDALEDFTKAIEQNPMYSNAYYNRGLIYIKLNSLELAKLDLEKAVQYNPQNIDARDALKDLNKKRKEMYDTTLPDWMLE